MKRSVLRLSFLVGRESLSSFATKPASLQQTGSTYQPGMAPSDNPSSQGLGSKLKEVAAQFTHQDPVCYVTTVTEWLADKGFGMALAPTQDQLPRKDSDSDSDFQPASLDTAAPPTVKVDGVWDVSVQTPIGKQRVKLTLQSDGNILSGALDGAEGRNEITEGTIDGSSVLFRASIKRPVKVRISYKAQIEGDKLTGAAKTPLLPTINFSGTRVATNC